MKIRSIDDDVTLEIERGGFGDPLDIDISVNGRGFSGSNYNVFPQSAINFLDELADLESTRKGKAVLSGMEGFCLTLESIGNIGEVSVSLELERSLSSSSSTGPRMYDYRLALGFPVSGENVRPMLLGLRRILTSEAARGDDV